MSSVPKSRIPVILITGYLGSGKTTFLNELLHQEKRKFAVIVNDMGEINIDAGLIKNDSIKNLDTRMIELSNGCICCTLRDEFMSELDKLSEIEGLEAIFVEASGISDPASIAEGFLAYEEMNEESSIFISSIVTVVDADRIYTEFLADLSNDEVSEDDPDIINLVVDQIEFCNIIILNKCDLVTDENLSEVKKAIRKLQPEAEIIETVNARVDAEKIIKGRSFNFDEAMNSSIIQKALKRKEDGGSCDDEYGITTFVFEERRPFDRDRFMQFLEECFPQEIIRAKGYIWFSDDPMHVELFESAGRNATVTEFSNWIAAFSEKDKKDVFDNYPEVWDEWDEFYGDRLNQIVFIGQDYDKEKICNMLTECISNEEINL